MSEDDITEKASNLHSDPSSEKTDTNSARPAQKYGGHLASFEDRYFIDLKSELKEYSTDSVRAYDAGNTQSNPRGLFAMICDPRYTPRTNVSKNYKMQANSTLPTLVEYGRVIMHDGTARYCYIYQNNLGSRVYNSDENIAMGWKTERLIETLLIPIVNCLDELQKRDVTHGNIRMSNLYDGGKKDFDKVKLGECLSVPASFNQPVMYEPIERAMADPIGRGEGTIKDDLYALGVILAMHVRNFDPQKGKSEDDIVAAKVVQGSYAALIGSSDRIASGISDLIRGLLSDNDKTRWGLEEVMDWLDGRRQNSKQPFKIKKAARGIEFMGRTFFYARTFAYRMQHNPQEVIPLIEGNELTHWIERSLDDREMLQRIEMAFESAKEGGAGVGYWDRLLPRISIAMDHQAPIRYRGMALHMNAIGNALALAFIEKKGMANFVELFNNGILHFWITTIAEMNIDVAEYVQLLDKVRGFLRQPGMMNGIERCLYFLNPSIHCLSPLVAEYYASAPDEYLKALESVAKVKAPNYPNVIIDQHAACFLVSRDPRLIEPHAFDLTSGQDFRHIIATLNILAAIQKFNDLGPLPHLTEWMCTLLNPVIERYHDSEYQKKLKKDIETKKEDGDLSKILVLLESPEKVKKDQVTYRRALAKYRELETEKQTLSQKMQKPKYFSERTGQEWAATISGVISVLIIIGFLLVHYGTEMPL